ncbi:MAG: alanyl-tRNA synthetase [Patescibacteria group bacterium]|jgi:alanyl-tRNA synthetase|nr:alanyl-tRNA synthetase [Patescibacteria group bacterium]
MTANEIRQKFLDFFAKRGHTVIPSASLVTSEEKGVTDSTLFNTAGMQPLVPYLLGEDHPGGKRLVDVQKCVRTGDIDEVGDNTHLTFFEMMGNWSLGDYWKEESIKWSYELLTSKEEGFGLDPKRLYVTVFGGNTDAPADNESFEIWKKYIPENRIYFLTWNGKKEPNWWEAGDNGPCGPDTEMFYDLTEEGLGDLTKEEYLKADDEQKVVEIWNNVFMEYVKESGKVVGKLKNKNVDTGSGLERVCAVLQNKDNVFDTDLFASIIKKIDQHSDLKDLRMQRIIADHIRTAVFLIGDGVVPSNTARGYILRRIIRRAVRFEKQISSKNFLSELATHVIDLYKEAYPELSKNENFILNTLGEEEERFEKTLEKGLKEFEKGESPFVLFTTYGFPIEITRELAKEKGLTIDEAGFNEEFKKHQELSQTSSAGMFKGGLADAGEETKRLHTATHLLRQALEDVLGEPIGQKGSNITAERLRFDFSFSRKLTDEEKKQVEDLVNQKIAEKLPMKKVVMKKEDAEKTGAAHVFGDKYGEDVSIYYIGETLETAYSKEFCGGPHVENTGELGAFKITKEEAVSQGVRRIKAVLQ